MKDKICPHCGKVFSSRGIGTHVWRVHTTDGLSFNGHSNYVKGSRSSWNKGLTKETNGLVKKMATATSKTNTGSKGRPHTEETKEKIREARLLYLEANPDKVPYLLNHSSKKSYPEQVFENALIASGITGWVYNYQHGLYSYDFAFPEFKVDVEIDGGTHLNEKVKKIDERRDAFSLSRGWVVIRFTAKEVKKDVVGCMNKIKEVIETIVK